MYRRQEAYLREWFQKTKRKPLIIRGARQVGKSTLVRQFCENNHIHLVEINLEKHFELEAIFNSKKPTKILTALEDILEEKISSKKKMVLFLDEIQAVPSALASLRYFYEDFPSMAVIGAGSLLEFLLNDHEYSMPVGRIEFLHMGPMNFDEFLMAKNEVYFLERISKLKKTEDLTKEIHQKGIDLLREFMYIGGMPEAIKQAVSNSIEEVASIHSQILQTYQDDFIKYAKKSHLQKIQNVFRYVFLNPCKKIKFTNISKEDLTRDLKLNLELLEEAKVVSFVKHSNCSGLPLEASENENIYKTLVLDVGLMNYAQGLSWKVFKNYHENEIITEGVIAEQFVGQHLLFQKPFYEKPRLNYWLREGQSHNAEVDFIVENDSYLIAIEVKSGAAGKIRSLHQWQKDIHYKKKKSVRFNLSQGMNERISYKDKDQILEYNLTTLPLYLIGLWRNFL